PRCEPSSFCQPFLPDESSSLAQSTCRAARFPRVNEHTPAHRRSAWATRWLASHTDLPKTLRTIPTYIIYDNVAQCFDHVPLSGAMRLFGKTERPAPLVTHGRGSPLSATKETRVAPTSPSLLPRQGSSACCCILTRRASE